LEGLFLDHRTERERAEVLVLTIFSVGAIMSIYHQALSSF